MFRLPDEIEALEAVEAMQRAVKARRVVEISYLGFLPVDKNRPDPRFAQKSRGHWWFHDTLSDVYGSRELLNAMPSHRVVEPTMVEWTASPRPVPWSRMWERAPYVDVIKYGPNGPRPGRIRLDHVVVRRGRLSLRVTDRPCVVRGTGLDPTIKRV